MPIELGSRRRERMLKRSSPIKVGSQYITYKGASAGTSHYNDVSTGLLNTSWSLLEKCWDELHHREKVIQYYVKAPCERRNKLSAEEALAYKTLFRSLGRHPPGLYAKVVRGKYYTSGGPFAKVMSDRRDEFIVKGIGTYINREIKPYEAMYVGGFLPRWDSSTPSAAALYDGYQANIQMSALESMHDGLEALGAKGWNKARPRTSLADLPTFIGELRDFPGMLRTTGKGFHDLWSTLGGKKYPTLQSAPKEIANHFLNHSFGWAPFVSDLMKFHEVYQNSDRLITQMLRDNGQWVRRKRRLEETTSVKSMRAWGGTTANVYPAALHDWMYKPRNGKKGTTNYWTEETSVTWFVGRFKYYIPRPPDNPDTRNYNRVMDMLRLYGVNISPSVIWNLTPWSWMADWFGNFGDIIDNITAQNNDNLVAKYAYVMRSKHTNYVNDSTVYLHGAPPEGIRVTWSRRVDTKARVKAYPFGFGLTGGGIDTPYRAAILAALGLTKGTGSARY